MGQTFLSAKNKVKKVKADKNVCPTYTMKCPKCWTEKAYRHQRRGWPATLMACVLLIPMKCHHCYHKFYASWFSTLGQQVQPPEPLARRTETSRRLRSLTLPARQGRSRSRLA